MAQYPRDLTNLTWGEWTRHIFCPQKNMCCKLVTVLKAIICYFFRPRWRQPPTSPSPKPPQSRHSTWRWVWDGANSVTWLHSFRSYINFSISRGGFPSQSLWYEFLDICFAMMRNIGSHSTKEWEDEATSVVTNIRIRIRIRIFSSESRIFGFGFVIFCKTNNIRIQIRNQILTSESKSI